MKRSLNFSLSVRFSLVEPRAGFDPATAALPSAAGDFWRNFSLFLRNEYTRKYAQDLFRYARHFHKCLENSNLSILKTLSKDKRLHAMKALSALSKFVGCYEHYKRLIKAYGLKWTVNNDDLIIARLIKYSNNGSSHDLFEWVKTVKRKIPEFAPFMEFITATGLRLSEAINSFNLVVQLKEQQKLSEYYDADAQALEHFRYREIFLRRTKKAFMSFVSQKLIDATSLSDLHVTKDAIDKRAQRLGFKCRFSDLRELWASHAVKHLRQPEIDFLQGRVSASVFMTNYFNPNWISDLKTRALNVANDLLDLTREQS